MCNNIFLIFGLGTTEIILIVLVVLLLFGGKKIPELMRGIGKGIKSFKDGTAGVEEDLKDLTADKTDSEKKTSSEKKTPPTEPAG